jgi:hypothetical protein
VDAVTAAWQRRQDAVAALALRRAQEAWGHVDPGNVRSTWAALVPATVDMLASAQYSAAAAAPGYVAAAVIADGATPAPAGAVQASRLAGVASDGRDLRSLIDFPAWQVEQARTLGMAPAQALEVGKRSLTRIVVTQVADAGRVATGLSIVNDRTVTGYIRQLGGQGCSRCVVLMGRVYRYNTGFLRHPQCKCVHRPTVLDPDRQDARMTAGPRAHFDSLAPADQDRIFTAAGAQAIRDGADPAQVVNAARGMSTASIGNRQIKITDEGVTRRGVAGQRARELGFNYRNTPRLMPEQIYRDATSRDSAIRLLHRFGYIR